MAATESRSQEELFAQVEGYDWDNDAEFQGGLRAILGSAQSPEQIAHLTTRARCFYYSKKSGDKVDFAAYQTWQADRRGISMADGSAGGTAAAVPAAAAAAAISPGQELALSSLMGNAPTPASFAEICALIAEGKPIPGIREIPNTVLEGQATTSILAQRKKPWEKDMDTVEGAGGT